MDRNNNYKKKQQRKAAANCQFQWRPVSVSSSSSSSSSSNIGESLVKDVANESEGGDHAQEVMKVAQVVADNSDSTISSGVLDDCFEPMLSAEKHSISLQVGASLIQFIKGKEGSTQKKIEEEMAVKIVFPSSKNEELIVIEGISTDCVTRASEKIQAIIDEAIKTNLDYSHFVSLPLGIYPELVDKLVDFQNSILGINDVSVDANVESDSNEDTSDIKNKGQELIKDFGIDETIFIKPRTFHLTVLMLNLWNKEQINAASDVLMSISSKVIDALDNRPIFIRLKGLDTMKGSLSRARVLYAPVEEIGSEDRLLRACQVIIDAFVEAGLVLEKDAKQKLKAFHSMAFEKIIGIEVSVLPLKA